MNRTGLLLFAALLLGGCEPSPDASKNTSTPPAAQQTPTVIDSRLIEITDATMERSKTFRVDGDLRPFWIVSGRIKNSSAQELRHVTFRIHVISRESRDSVDSATIAIDTDIAPYSKGSFSREIQILPPKSGWDWQYEIVQATSD